MADNFKIALQASIDIKKSQNEINKQIRTLKTDSIKIGIELDTKSAQKAISELSKEAKSLMEQDTLISNNNINSSLSNNPIINGELTSKLKEVKGELKSTDKIELTNLNKQFKNVTSETESLGKKGDTVFSNLGKKISNLLIDLAVNTLRNMVNEVANLDKSLVDLQMATGYTHSQAKELLSTYIDLGQQMGATGTEVADIASDYLRQGKTVAEANALVKDSLILSKIGNMESADATTYLTTIMKGYKVSVSDVIDIIDKLSAVDLASAASTEGLAQAMSKTAENAEMSGISMDKLLGIIAVIGDSTGEEMSSVGDSVNSMLSRMNNIKLSNLIDPETGEDLSNVETSLNNVGISLKDTGDTYRDFGDVLDETAGKWDTYSSATQQNIAASIAGKEHMGDFLILMSEYSKANEYATASTNSSGSAMEQFANYENSLEAKTKSLTASFQKLASDSLDSGVIKGFIDLANALIQVIDKVGIFNIALVSLAGVLGAKSTLSANAFTSSLQGLVSMMGATSTAARTMMSAALRVALPIAAIIGAVAIYNKLNVTLTEHKERLNEAKQEYAQSSFELENINKELEITASKIKELSTKSNLTFIQKEELEKLKEASKQLTIQQDILQKKNAQDKKDLAVNAVETFNSQFGDFNINKSKDYLNTIAQTYGDLNLLDNIDTNKFDQVYAAYSKITDQIKLYKEAQIESQNSGDVKQANIYADIISRYKGEELGLSDQLDKTGTNSLADLQGYIEDLKEPYDALKKDMSNGIVLSKTNQSIVDSYENAKELLKQIYLINSPETWKNIQFQDVISKDEFKDVVKEFKELSQTKLITPEQISKASSFMNALKDAGISAEDAAEQFNAMSDSSKAALNESIKSNNANDDSAITVIENISKLNNSLSSLESAYSSLTEKQSVSIDDIAAMSEVFGKTKGFDDFIKTLSTAKSITPEVQQAFNNLVSTYLSTSGVLDNLTDDNKQLIATQLQHIGISNAEEVVTNKLAQTMGTAEYEARILSHQKQVLAETGIDVKNATADEIIELLKERDLSDDTRIALSNLAMQKLNANNIALSTSGDIQSLINLMSMANITTNALSALQEVKSGKSILGISGRDIPYLTKMAQDEANTYFKSLQVNYSNVKYNGGEKSKSATDKQKKTEDKPINNFSQVFDWIEIRIDKLKEKAQKAIDDVGKYINFKYKNNQLKVAITAQVDEKKSLTSLMDSYNKKADSIKFPKKYEKYKDLVDNGGINVQTIKNEALAKKIEEYQKWKEAAAGVADEIEKIDDKIKELNAQKLDNITEYFGNINDYISAKISRKESEVSLKTDSGKSPTKHDYNALIKLENDNKKNNQKELDAYSTEFYQQIKDKDIKKDSPEYLKGLSHINDLTKAINESQSAVYNYNAEIRELDWKGFDKGITKVNNTKNELADLSDMIKDSEILDDKGNYTEAGLTKVGLLSQQMSSNTKLSSEYGKAIKKIGVELKNHKISQELYNEELANYQSLQRQAIKDNQALEESIAEIAKQRVQYEIDAINKETTAFKELVDAKKDALQAEKDLHDYQESINKKQKSIDTLQKQIAALKSSTERSDIAKRLKLEKDLKDQQADLDEEQYQHSVEAQSNALDDEYDSYKKSQDEKVTALEKSLNDQEALVKSALNEVYSNTTEISTGIQTLASKHGLTVSESIVSPWENAKTAIDAYKTALAGLPVSNNPNLDGAVSGAEIGIGADSTAKGTAGSSNNGASSQKTKKESASSNNPKNKESKSKLPISTVKYTANKSSLNKDSSIVDRLKYFDLDSSTSARSKLYKYFGLSGSYTGLDEQNIKLIAAMKKAGFSKGGSGKLANSLEDEGFALMKRDETTLSSEQTEQFKSLLGYAPMIKAAIDSITGENNYSSIQNTNNPVNVHYDNLITVQGNVDSNNIDQLKFIAQQAVEKGNRTLISLLNQKR